MELQPEGKDLLDVQHPAQEPQEAANQGGVDQEVRRPGHAILTCQSRIQPTYFFNFVLFWSLCIEE